MGGTGAERYGVRHLGAIRSLVSVVMVVSVALASLLIGLMVDRSVNMQTLTTGLADYTVVASLLGPCEGRLRER